MTIQLTKDEYLGTMGTKMVDVTDTAEPAVDIWPYIQQLTKDKLVLEYFYENNLVEKVYKNDTGTFDHVLIPTDNQNIFVVIVVDLPQAKIKGHYKLDLEEEYGIK